MFEIRRPFLGVLLALCASASFASHSIAPPRFNAEMMQTHQETGRIALAFWLSTEMFRNAVADKMKPEEVQQVVNVLKGYAIYAIVDARLDTDDSSFVSVDRAEMRASARLHLGDRAPRAALAESELTPGVRAAAQVLKPLMVNMLGKFGGTMEFVVFNDADEHGVSLADPRGSLPVSLSFDKESFAWRLPVVSLQPRRIDTATGDTFPGDYEFSPFTGNKLVVVK